MLCEVGSGNVVLLISLITGAPQSDIEDMIMCGISPWAVADYFGKLDEFQSILYNNMEESLTALVESGEMTEQMADIYRQQFSVNAYE